MKLAVVGAGWAGLAAAVRATQSDHRVSLFEMAAQMGGRARRVDVQGLGLDNGQHILIGAYTRTLALLHTLDVDLPAALHRGPLALRYPDGRGLALPAGPAWWALGLGVARCRGWSVTDKLALLRAAAGWALAGFCCPPEMTVARLCAGLPPAVRQLLIDPLCVAALNTAAGEASADVFLRVLKDALFGGDGAADLLLPRGSLGALLPEPAAAWLQRHGAQMHLGHRVRELQADGGAWRVDGEAFDAAVVATTAAEAARLTAAVAPGWARQAAALVYEPIVTVYLRCPGARLPATMTTLQDGPQAPAQFAFDHGAMGATQGLFSFVVSAARAWVDAGLQATAAAVLAQAERDFPAGTWPSTPTVFHAAAEKRATFRCLPGISRPAAKVAPGLVAAGDYIQGPYPATLEAAVRAGEAAVALLQA